MNGFLMQLHSKAKLSERECNDLMLQFIPMMEGLDDDEREMWYHVVSELISSKVVKPDEKIRKKEERTEKEQAEQEEARKKEEVDKKSAAKAESEKEVSQEVLQEQLKEAVRSENLEVVKRLLAQGVDVNSIRTEFIITGKDSWGTVYL